MRAVDLEPAASLVLVLDRNGRVARCNRAGASAGGQAAEAATGRPVWELFPGRDDEGKAAWLSALSRIEGGEGEAIFDAEWTADGESRYATWSLIPLPGVGGLPGSVIASGLDITDRRLAELRLAASAARLRGIFASTPLALCVVDELGSVVEANAAAERMFGYAAGEILGRRMVELTHPDDADEARELVGRLVRDELAHYQSDHRYLTKDGRVFWGRLTVAPIPSADARARHAIATLEDVTAEIATKKALQERTETLQAIVQSASVGIVALDREARVTLWNPAAERMFGWTREEALGQRIPIVGPEHEVEFRTFFDRALGGGMLPDTDIRRRRKDGAPIDLRVSSAPLRDPGGAVVGVITMLADASARKRAETALRQAEDRFRHAFEDAPIGMALTSVDGRLLRVNRALGDILGYSRDELLELSYRDITHPDDIAATADLLGAVISGQTPTFQMEKRYVRAGGETIWVHVAASVVRDDEGNPVYLIAQMSDVTERRRVGDALRRSEESLQDLFDNAAELIFTVSPEGRFEFVNRACRHELGYDEDDLEDLTIEDIVAPECRAAYLDVLEGVMAGETVSEIATVFRAKGGRRVDVEGNVSCRMADGVPVAARAIFRDVSQRKLTERALQDSAARLRTIFETAAEGIVTIDERGAIDTVNGTAAQLFGYRPEELVGQNISMLMPEPDRGRHDEILHAYLATGEQRAIGREREVTGLRKDGTTFPMELMVSEMSIGARRMFTGMVRDITERKRAEQALADTATRLQTIFDTAAEGIVTIDERGRVDVINRAAAELFGYEPEEIVGQDLSILLPEQHRTAHARHFDARPRSDAGNIMGQVREISGRRKDGTTFPIEVVVNEMELGTSRMYTSLIRDITLRKQVEEEREQRLAVEQEARRVLAEQNERLLELDRMKDDFVSIVSHELRTPLTSIVGYIDLLREEEAGPLAPDQHRFLDVVQRSCDRLLRLVGDLLVLMQIEADALELEVAELDPATIIGDSLEAAGPIANQRGVELTAEIGPLPALTGDRVRLAQVLDNLISNAVKFTPAGGRVEVRARHEGGQLMVEIADTGAGIPAEEQPGIFNRFFRSSTATKNAVPGTGLGLAISKAIVEAHSGTIEFESEAARGTTFTVALPAPGRPAPAVELGEAERAA